MRSPSTSRCRRSGPLPGPCDQSVTTQRRRREPVAGVLVEQRQAWGAGGGDGGGETRVRGSEPPEASEPGKAGNVGIVGGENDASSLPATVPGRKDERQVLSSSRVLRD